MSPTIKIESSLPLRSTRILAQFDKKLTKPKSKVSSKKKVDFRPVPRDIQLQASQEAEELKRPELKDEVGMPLPITGTIKDEPDVFMDPACAAIELESSSSPLPALARSQSGQTAEPDSVFNLHLLQSIKNDQFANPSTHAIKAEPAIALQPPKLVMTNAVRDSGDHPQDRTSTWVRDLAITQTDPQVDIENANPSPCAVATKKPEKVQYRIIPMTPEEQRLRESGVRVRIKFAAIPPNCLPELEEFTRPLPLKSEERKEDMKPEVKAPKVKKGVRFATTAIVRMYDCGSKAPRAKVEIPAVNADVGASSSGTDIDDLLAFLDGCKDSDVKKVPSVWSP